jgi:bacillithiol synthase
MHEIASFALLKNDLQLLSFSLKEHLFLRRQPTGTIPVDDPEIRKILIRVFHELGSPQLREFYSIGTLTDGFARTLIWLLRDFPILLVDPSDPDLKQIAAPFFRRFFQNSDALLRSLDEQNTKLKERKYPVQVQMEEDRLPMFQIEELERKPVPRGTDLSAYPENLSPSALLRPLFQDYLFPTLAYVGGPAEIAYFAQNHEWYRILEIDQPSLKARASLTLIPPATRSFLDSRRLEPSEIYLQEDTLIDALLDHEGMKQTRNEIRNLEDTLKTAFVSIHEGAMKIDPTLEKSLKTSSRKMKYQLQKMERKAFLAAKRKNVVLAEQIRKAKNVIYPDDKLQERYLNMLSFHSRLPEMIHQIYAQIQWDAQGHQYIDL